MTHTPSRRRRLFRRVLLFLIAAAAVVGIIWGVGTVVNRVQAQQDAEARLVAYAATATALIPGAIPLPSHTAAPPVTDTPAATDAPTETATNTSTATDTPTATATESDTPTFTPSMTDTPEATAVLMQFATNTASFTPTFTPTATATATHTATATATHTPFPTNTPPATATLPVTDTPRPLPTILYPPDSTPRAAAPTAIPSAVPLADRRDYDIMNIILLGSDGSVEPGDPSYRTDTMIIVSINRSTNTVAMLPLPRDMYVFIPGWTMQRLNLAYQHGESGGWTDGGFGLLRQTILYNFGIPIHYYASIEFEGFQTLIDTLGGVDIAVDCAIQDYRFEGYDAWDEPIYQLYTLPVGLHHLDSDMALWYARSRRNSDDFDRGRRQMQLLLAIYHEAEEQGLLGQFLELWPRLNEIVDTNLTLPDMVGLLPIALNIDPSQINTLNFIRTYHTTPWQPPDGVFVQLPNWEPISQLVNNLYLPPTENQLVREGARIEVLNGTTNEGWAWVAADRLAWEGFVPVVSDDVDSTDYPATIVTDFTGRTKGSSLNTIIDVLNVHPDNVHIEPDANAEYDFQVVLGANYDSCTFGVLDPMATPTPSATPSS